jgi:hypothetical protein
MTYVCIASGKPNSIGQLKGTLGRIFAVERCNIMISGLMNDINSLVLDEIIIGHTQNDQYHVIEKVKQTDLPTWH